jgi:hypothetical protein
MKYTGMEKERDFIMTQISEYLSTDFQGSHSKIKSKICNFCRPR